MVYGVAMSGSVGCAGGPYREPSDIVPDPPPYIEPVWKRLGLLFTMMCGPVVHVGIVAAVCIQGSWLPGLGILLGLLMLIGYVVGPLCIFDDYRVAGSWRKRWKAMAACWSPLFFAYRFIRRVTYWIIQGGDE